MVRFGKQLMIVFALLGLFVMGAMLAVMAYDLYERKFVPEKGIYNFVIHDGEKQTHCELAVIDNHSVECHQNNGVITVYKDRLIITKIPIKK